MWPWSLPPALKSVIFFSGATSGQLSTSPTQAEEGPVDEASEVSVETKESDAEPECSRSVPVECLICSELADDNVILEPCKHKLACEECSSRMKKCVKCGTQISKRISHGELL